MCSTFCIMKKHTEYVCLHCGQDLTEENCRPSSDNISGFSHYCIDCEQKYFAKLAECEGASLAIFHCCAAFNVPCLPIVLENFDMDGSDILWIDYITLLDQWREENNMNTVDSFFDGETNILCIFGKKMSQTTFAEYITHERAKLNKLPGTITQRMRWGTRDGYRTEDYNELDALYNNRVESYKGQTLTPQMNDVLIKVVKWNYKADELIRNRNYSGAKQLLDMADKLLASENMRKKDEKPVEGFELQSQVVALERAGLMEEGKFLPIDKMQEVLFKRFIKSRKYDYTLDVCDAIIERMYNTMRANADAYIRDELPAELDVDDNFDEFSDEETDDEREHKRFTNTVNVTFEKPQITHLDEGE